MKKVRCGICGKLFPEKDAKYDLVRPAIGGIYTLCPDCYLPFMAIYRGSKKCPKCLKDTLIEYSASNIQCSYCGHRV